MATRCAMAPACAAIVGMLFCSAALAQLTVDERACSDAINKIGRSIGGQEAKANRSCVKNGDGDISDCVGAESDKASDKRGKLIAAYSGVANGKCATLPSFGVNADPGVIADQLEAGADDIVAAIYGTPPNGVLAGDACADKLAKDSGKKYDTVLKVFRACAKDLPAINGIADLEGCVGTALSEAKVTGAQLKLASDVSGKCTMVPPLGAEDGQCATTTAAAQLADCAGDAVNCQACLAIASMIDSHGLDCDLLDNGTDDGSCVPRAVVCPTGGTGSLCFAAEGQATCETCCMADSGCSTACTAAAGPGCDNSFLNQACADAIAAAGCASACCPP